MAPVTAVDIVKNKYMTQEELAKLLNITTERIRDLRSNHATGKAEFMVSYQPTSKAVFFDVNDVLEYIHKHKTSKNGS